MSRVTINGVTVEGDFSGTVRVRNGVLTIDGVNIDLPDTKIINVEVHGDIGAVEASTGDVKVAGNSGSITTTTGGVTVGGGVTGDIRTTTGDVKCGTVGGSVKTTTGDIRNDK